MDWKKQLLDIAETEMGYDPERLKVQAANKQRRQNRAVEFKLRQERNALRLESRYRTSGPATTP